MNKEEILEQNLLIANFMGLEMKITDGVRYPEGKHQWLINLRPHRKDYDPFGTKEYVIEKINLQYHSSWDWLMPVVEKIADYHYPEYYSGRPKSEDEGQWDDCAYPRTFGMRDNEGNFMVRLNANTLFSAPTLLEAAWLAVVDFIKWYNQSQNKTIP